MAINQSMAVALLEDLTALKPERFRKLQRTQCESIYRVSLAQPGEALDDLHSTLIRIVHDTSLSSQNDSLLTGAVFSAIASEDQTGIALEANPDGSCGCTIFWGGFQFKTDHHSMAIACLDALVKFYKEQKELVTTEGAA